MKLTRKAVCWKRNTSAIISKAKMIEIKRERYREFL